MVLPAGTTLPPLAHLLVLAVAAGAVGWGLRRAGPAVGERTVLALAPWMVAGGAGYVVYQRALAPAVLAPLLSSPAVYVTSGVLAGGVWLLTLAAGRDPAVPLAVTGGLVAVPPVALAVAAAPTLAPALPGLATGAAAGVAGLAWWLLRVWEPEVEVLGWAGVLTVFGHALDALTTTVGVVHLGFGEQTPLSRLLIEAGAGLPVPLLGAAWPFVVAKLLLAAAVTVLLAPSARRRPRQGFLLLALVAAVGLGPGAHNALLFSVVTP